jgi:hypothetical protein
MDQRVPGALRYAAWLTAKRKLARARWSALALVVAAVLLIQLSSLSDAASRALALLDRYRWALAAVAFVHALLLVARERRQIKEEWQRSWLVAAPLTNARIEMWVTMRTSAIACVHLTAAITVVLLLAVFARAFDEAAAICGMLATVFVPGAVVGRFLPSTTKVLREDSRYAPKARAGHVASADALSRWPIAHALSRQRPENARVTILIALFSVQGGSSMLVGLIVVISWLLGIYLATLAQATLHVSQAAAQWLKVTPIRFAAFAWPLARRLLMHQLIGSSIATAFAIAMGLPIDAALYILALWLAIVICVLCVSLADAFCVRQSGAKLALMLATAIGIELRLHGWAVPGLLMISAWHIRRAMLRLPR